ncbi:hypothetical protein KM043_000922 [Ampulex compressa]|nr:hypothetical protein KM043_000922 [Ampulex compressa]
MGEKAPVMPPLSKSARQAVAPRSPSAYRSLADRTLSSRLLASARACSNCEISVAAGAKRIGDGTKISTEEEVVDVARESTFAASKERDAVPIDGRDRGARLRPNPRSIVFGPEPSLGRGPSCGAPISLLAEALASEAH